MILSYCFSFQYLYEGVVRTPHPTGLSFDEDVCYNEEKRKVGSGDDQ